MAQVNTQGIPMGRRHYLFCWTELGAKQGGIIQSLLVTCKLQGINPSYTYLVGCPAAHQPAPGQVIELTPRV